MFTLTDHFARRESKVAELDLTLQRPGHWILDGYALPYPLVYTRQHQALGYAEFKARDAGTMIVRLHNEWSGARSR